MEQFDMYKVVSINADGKTVVAYASPAHKRFVAKSMAEQYGNVEVEGVYAAEIQENPSE
jgi:TctA family transporter